jgi:dTDP-4-dehydrorhamnose reductase
MKTLVFGKDGQLGRAFQQRLSSIPNVYFLGRQECNLASSVSVKNCIEQFMPDQIINAAAYTAVDKAEDDMQTAFAINEGAVAEMASYCHINNKRLLHFSTDYVFNGQKSSPYVESDVCNPLNVYGQSKRAGERMIQEIFSKKENNLTQVYGSGTFFILRTTWVYGDGTNFIRKILRLAKERSELKIVSDQYGVPTSADWLSNLSLILLDRTDIPSGIYHATPSGRTNWYELAQFVLECAKELEISFKLEFDHLFPIPANQYSLPAKRPENSIFSTEKLSRTLLPVQSLLEEDWRTRVKAYIYALHKQGSI